MLKQILEKVNNSPKNSNSLHGQPNTSHWFYTPHVIWQLGQSVIQPYQSTVLRGPPLHPQKSRTQFCWDLSKHLERSRYPFRKQVHMTHPWKNKIIDSKVPLKRGYVKFPRGYLHVGHPCFTAGFFHMSFCPKAGSPLSRHIFLSKSFKLNIWFEYVLYCISSYIECFYMKNPSSFQQSQFLPSHLLYEKIFSSHTIQLYTFPAQDPFLSPFLGANSF